MLRHVLSAVIFIGLSTTPLLCHEVKIFSSRNTFPAEGGKGVLFLSWGHRTPVDDFIDGSTLSQFDLISPDGKTRNLKIDGVSLQANSVDFKEPGTHLAIVAKKPTIYTYIVEDNGERRLKRGTRLENKGSKIDYATRYLQFGKSYFTVGPLEAKAPKPVGLPFEIVALDGPAAWKVNQDIKFQILLDGKPVATADALARPVGFKPDDAWSYATDSNKTGVFSIRPNSTGIWAIKVHHKALAGTSSREEYDLVSYTTTLTLEIQP